MKKEIHSSNDHFELDDFWGFSDSSAQNKKSVNDDEDWNFDDLFAAKEEKEAQKLEEERLATAREATRRQIEAEFAAKRKLEEEAAAKAKEEERLKSEAEAAEMAKMRRQAEEKAKMSQTRRKPNVTQNTEEAPDPQEFSDSSTMGLNRLKPEIHLTSVEPEIRKEGEYNIKAYATEEFEYLDDEYEDDEYDGSEYEYEDGEYDDDEYDDDEYEYEDGEYDDDEYEYKDDEYDDDDYDDDYDYDYEAEEEPRQPAAVGYVPLKKEDHQSATVSGRKKEYGTEDDWKALSEELDDDEDEKSKKPLIIGIVCGIVVLILVGVIIWAFNRGDGSSKENGQYSSQMTQQLKTSGVITGIDANNQTILVYDAMAAKELSLSVKESKDLSGLLSSLSVGDVVDVEYQIGTTNELTKLTEAAAALTLKDVKNAVPNGSIVDISGHTYYIDDKLVCLYQGQAFDVKMISENTVYDAIVLDDHIYTIKVTYATGSLKIENLNEYVNATMILIPASGEQMEFLITGEMEPIDVQEGSVEIQIKKQDETLYTGKTFISAGKVNTLKLPSAKDQKGKVVFSSNVDAEMTIMVNGKEYTGTDEIELAYGDYTGIFTAPGYEDVEQKFTISQPYQQINVEFEENTTLVTISASIWGVSLYVDGVYQGELEGSSISVRLAPGAHSITCTRTGYYDQMQSIMILEGMDDQMVYFSGFIAEEVEPEPESSTPVEESSTPVEESSTPVEESSTTTEESSTPTEGSNTTGGESTPTTNALEASPVNSEAGEEENTGA